MKTILITGAAGDVGTHLRRDLAGKYVLKVSDLRSLKKINREEKFVCADISKFSDALRITKGVDAVVHLGGDSVEGPWDAILNANIIGCYNVFEAARSENAHGRVDLADRQPSDAQPTLPSSGPDRYRFVSSRSCSGEIDAPK